MDIVKIEKSDLALLNDDVAKIAKYHEQVVALKKPSITPERPNYLVLGNMTGSLEKNVSTGGCSYFSFAVFRFDRFFNVDNNY